MAARLHHHKKRAPYHLKKKRQYKGRRHFHQKHKRKTESRRGWAAKGHRRGAAASIKILKHRSLRSTRFFTINAVGQHAQRARSRRGDRVVNAANFSRRLMAVKQSPQHLRVPRHRWF